MFSAYIQLAAGGRSRRVCSPGSQKHLRGGHGLCPPAHSQQGLLSWGLKFMTMPLFIHSTHLPCAQHRTAAQLTVLSALINVPDNYLAQQRIP